MFSLTVKYNNHIAIRKYVLVVDKNRGVKVVVA